METIRLLLTASTTVRKWAFQPVVLITILALFMLYGVPAHNQNLIPTRFNMVDFKVDAKPGCLALLAVKIEAYKNSVFSAEQGLEIHFEIFENGKWENIPEDEVSYTHQVSTNLGWGSNYYIVPDDNPTEFDMQIRAVFDGMANYQPCKLNGYLSIHKSTTDVDGPNVITHNKIPLILVHGNGSDKEKLEPYHRWDGLLDFANNNPDKFANFDIIIWKHDTELPVGFNGNTGNAKELAVFVNNVLAKYDPGTKVIFVAHSRGGLVCRSYMNYDDQGDKVLGLITLGTPHHGSPFAVPDWTGISWDKIFGSTGTLSSMIFNSIYNTGFLIYQFEYDRIGSLNLAWDNMDNAVNQTITRLIPDILFSNRGSLQLTKGDLNYGYSINDATVIYSPLLKARFGDLQTLNQNKKYNGNIITYGVYQTHLLLESELKARVNDLLNPDYEHFGLNVLGSVLASYSDNILSNDGPCYYANDGMVPIQSALFLDISGGMRFSTRKSLDVALIDKNIEDRVQVRDKRIFSSRDGISDHKDLLDTKNKDYWNALAADINSFLPKGQKKKFLALLLDSSSSMKSSDPNDVRKEGARMIMDHLAGLENIFVVDFDNTSRWLNPDMFNNWDPQALKRIIDQIDSDGNTYIGGGLNTMQQALDGSLPGGSDGVVLLLTDGQDNTGNTIDNLGWYKDRNYPIYTISYKDQADKSLMNTIAGATNGRYIQANSPGEVLTAFLEIVNDLKGLNKLTSQNILIYPGQRVKSRPFIVEIGSRLLKFINTWPGSTVGMQLHSPAGKVYNSSNCGSWLTGATYILAEISDPEPGTWYAEFEGIDVSSGGEPVLFEVSVDSDLDLSLNAKADVSGIINLKLDQLKGNIDYNTVNYSIQIQSPSGAQPSMTGMLTANGIQIIPVDGSGNYNMEVSLNGKMSSGENFERQYFRSVLIGNVTPSYIGQVIFAEGRWVKSNQGLASRAFPGLRCVIYPRGGNPGDPIAMGYVSHVYEDYSDIIIDQFTTNQQILSSDFIVQFDIEQWKRD